MGLPATQLLYQGGPGLLFDGGRKAHQDTINHAVAAITDLARHLIERRDNRERVEYLVVDERAHRIPLALQAQAVQFRMQIPPAVQLENLAVGGS